MPGQKTASEPYFNYISNKRKYNKKIKSNAGGRKLFAAACHMKMLQMLFEKYIKVSAPRQ